MLSVSMNIHFVEVNGSKADQPHCFCGTSISQLLAVLLLVFVFFCVCFDVTGFRCRLGLSQLYMCSGEQFLEMPRPQRWVPPARAV